MKRVLIGVIVVVALAVGGGWAWLSWYGAASQDPAFFEDDIRAFEAEPVVPGAIVFTGSSSVRLWGSLAEDMAPLPVLNRGFGGSQMEHVVRFARRIALPHTPRAVVVYAGDNDLDARTGKTADVVIADFQELVATLRAELPDVRIYYLAIKPSKLRWERWPEMSRANAGIEAICDADPQLRYLDVATPLLGPDGTPRDDVFVFDGLHMNANGYAAWTEVVRPALLQDLGGG
jgi:lysophospholipase L1-like esterase